MFGAPTTKPSGFASGATGGSAPGGGSGSTGFAFGAPSGGATGTGTGTTGGLGGFGMAAAGTLTTTAGAAGGFNFAAAATKAATGTTGGFSGFSFGGPQPTQAQPAPAASTGFSFGATPGATTGGAPGGAGLQLGGAGTGFGLKPPATTATSTPAAGAFTGFSVPTTTSSTGSMLSGLLGSTTSAATPATVATVPTTTLAPTGFSLGTASFGTTSTTTPSMGFGGPSFMTSTATSTAPTTGPTGFSFNKAIPIQQATSTTTTASILPTFGSSSVASAVTSSTSITAPSSFPGAPGQKQMTFRQLEDTINKWTTELEEQEKYFLDQATQVNAWDRIVMENGEKIIQLNGDVEKVKLDQQKLDHELDFVHSQQRELEALLTPLEKALDSMPPISYQQHADVERENTYMLAESLDAQLKRMGQDLKEIIERLNTTNSAPDPNDPVQQITKILNAHVVSLMWVDRNSANLQRRVEEISRQMDIEKREQERNFRLAYS